MDDVFQTIKGPFDEQALYSKGGTIKIDEIQSDFTTRRLKKPPAGKKGKGLRKLPRPVRNKMGYMSGGGVANGYGRAAMRPGKDPRTVSKT